VLASSKFATDIGSLLHGYQLCAATEGKSPNTIAIVTNSVRYLYDFLSSNGLSTDVTQIGTEEIRAFILHLQQKRRLAISLAAYWLDLAFFLNSTKMPYF